MITIIYLMMLFSAHGQQWSPDLFKNFNSYVESGKAQCFSANRQKRSCESLVRYRIDGDNISYKADTAVPITGITMSIDGELLIRDNLICFRKGDIYNALFFNNDVIVADEELLIEYREAVSAEFSSAERCYYLSSFNDMFFALEIIGVSSSFTVGRSVRGTWIDEDERYSIELTG